MGLGNFQVSSAKLLSLTVLAFFGFRLLPVEGQDAGEPDCRTRIVEIFKDPSKLRELTGVDKIGERLPQVDRKALGHVRDYLAQSNREIEASSNAVSGQDEGRIEKIEEGFLRLIGALGKKGLSEKEVELLQVIVELEDLARDHWKLGHVISAIEFSNLQSRFQVNENELLIALSHVAFGYALPFQSEYLVGEAALLDDGSVILGVNVELGNSVLSMTIHGEQFIYTRAAQLKRRVHKLALAAPPCGHCRQFINESVRSGELLVLITGYPSNIPFPAFLPVDFGPHHLGNLESAFLNHPSLNLVMSNKGDPSQKITNAVFEAVHAAEEAYSPYTQSPSGVSLLMKDGSIYSGSYYENVAFNPSLGAISSAFVRLFSERLGWSLDLASRKLEIQQILAEIDKIIVVERPPQELADQASTNSEAKLEPYRPNFTPFITAYAQSIGLSPEIVETHWVEIVSYGNN